MNGWEKITGGLIALSGIVYIIAVVLGVADGLSITDDCLEAFADLDKFAYLSVVAGVIAIIAGGVALCLGVSNKQSSKSALGILLVFLGFIVVVTPYRDDISTLSWENIEIILTGISIAVAAAAALVCISNKRYFYADIAIILAYVAFIVAIVDLKMVDCVVAIIAVIGSGLVIMIPAKPVEAKVEEEAKVPTYQRTIVPASEKVAANPPVKKEEPAPAKEEAKPAPAKKAEAAPAKEEAKQAEEPKSAEAKPAEAAVAKEATAEDKPKAEEGSAAPAKEEAKSAEAAVAAAVATAAAAEPKEETEEEKLLRQGYELTVATVGEDKAEEMSDYEIMETVYNKDPELYAKLSAITGIVVTPAAEEESDETKLLRQGYELTVATVGEDKAEEMSDYEIMETVYNNDSELYVKLSAITGIVIAAEIVEESAEAPADEKYYSDEELGLTPDTPNGFVRRACWNKGLRCRKDYGSFCIPIAFVKSKVAVYVDGATPDNSNDAELQENGWIVIHFKESDITDGAAQAEVVNDAVKENTRAMKKAKAKAKKKR